MTESWHNGSGSVMARPAQIAAPRSEDELAAVVRAATRLRVVGAGHSFAPLCATDGTLVRLDGLDGDAGPGVHLAPDGRDPQHKLAHDHLTRLFDLEAPERP